MWYISIIRVVVCILIQNLLLVIGRWNIWPFSKSKFPENDKKNRSIIKMSIKFQSNLLPKEWNILTSLPIKPYQILLFCHHPDNNHFRFFFIEIKKKKTVGYERYMSALIKLPISWEMRNHPFLLCPRFKGKLIPSFYTMDGKCYCG